MPQTTTNSIWANKMSIAGVRSNRGDGYQTYVALGWALSVLLEPEYEWIEVDSLSWLVDDVVIGRSDGSVICCQCKKNQIDFKDWKISDFADELDKAANVLVNDKKAEIRFYSRSPFGELAKLREHCTTQAGDDSFYASLGKEHKKINGTLSEQISSHTNFSTYEFLCRTSFESSPELGRMESLLRERLRYAVCNADTAFDSLWRHIDQLGARIEGTNQASVSIRHRLTKEDIKTILQQAGAILAQNIDIGEVRSLFATTSAIGRAWRRDIAGLSVANSVVSEILAAIDARKCSILLTGPPGSGKTCVMLSVQEALEQIAQTRTDITPIFIQSREFADVTTSQDRQALGLHEKWVEKAARMSEESHVVVVIDSLDVLSIAREHSVLTYFLAQIDRLLSIENVTIVTACRDFDRRYDRRISERQWDCELKCSPWDWNTEIAPLLNQLSVDLSTIDVSTRELIKNPRELALFIELAQRNGGFSVVTSQALAQRYLDIVIRANNLLGEAAIQAIEDVASEMLNTRSLSLHHQRFNASKEIKRALLSHDVLHETHDGKLTFGHQTLLDILVISRAIRNGVTLNQFIHDLSPVPFVRPSVRGFIAQLVTEGRQVFRKQVRTVLTGKMAFHMRRLVAESFAEQLPQDEDWPLIRELRDKHREVFQVIYTQAQSVEWHHFWLNYLIPLLKDNQDSEGVQIHTQRVSHWKNEDTEGVLAFWSEVLTLHWVDAARVAWQLEHSLSDVHTEKLALLLPLLEHLLTMPRQEHSFLGRAVSRCVTAGKADDVLLWRYIAGDICNEDVLKFRFDKKLHCQPHEFGGSNNEFLSQRMQASIVLCSASTILSSSATIILSS